MYDLFWWGSICSIIGVGVGMASAYWAWRAKRAAASAERAADEARDAVVRSVTARRLQELRLLWLAVVEDAVRRRDYSYALRVARRMMVPELARARAAVRGEGRGELERVLEAVRECCRHLSDCVFRMDVDQCVPEEALRAVDRVISVLYEAMPAAEQAIRAPG